MIALVLAAGKGTRLAPYTNKWPKCMMPIQGIPLLSLWIKKLSDSSIDRILINSHYQADIVHQTYSNHEMVSLHHEQDLLGTAGTIRNLKTYLCTKQTLILHGDNYSDVELSQVMQFHDNHKYPITMVTFETHNPESCGIVVMDSNNVLIEFHEKVRNPPSNIASAAIYIFDNIVIDFVGSRSDIFDISTDLIPHYIGKIKCYNHGGFNIDIGTEHNLRLSQNIQKNNTLDIPVNLRTNHVFNKLVETFREDIKVNNE